MSYINHTTNIFLDPLKSLLKIHRQIENEKDLPNVDSPKSNPKTRETTLLFLYKFSRYNADRYLPTTEISSLSSSPSSDHHPYLSLKSHTADIHPISNKPSQSSTSFWQQVKNVEARIEKNLATAEQKLKGNFDRKNNIYQVYIESQRKFEKTEWQVQRLTQALDIKDPDQVLEIIRFAGDPDGELEIIQNTIKYALFTLNEMRIFFQRMENMRVEYGTIYTKETSPIVDKLSSFISCLHGIWEKSQKQVQENEKIHNDLEIPLADLKKIINELQKRLLQANHSNSDVDLKPWEESLKKLIEGPVQSICQKFEEIFNKKMLPRAELQELLEEEKDTLSTASNHLEKAKQELNDARKALDETQKKFEGIQKISLRLKQLIYWVEFGGFISVISSPILYFYIKTLKIEDEG